MNSLPRQRKLPQISAAAISRGLVYEPRQKFVTLVAISRGLVYEPRQKLVTLFWWPFVPVCMSNRDKWSGPIYMAAPLPPPRHSLVFFPGGRWCRFVLVFFLYICTRGVR